MQRSGDGPTIWRVLVSEYVLLSFTSFMILVGGVFVVLADSAESIIVGIGSIIFSMSIVVWWHGIVCRAFECGRRVKGEVLFTNSWHLGYGIRYSFEDNEKSTIQTAVFLDCARINKIKKGDMVTIIIDPRVKRRTFIEEAYI